MIAKLTIDASKYADLAYHLRHEADKRLISIKSAPRIDPSNPENITLTVEFVENDESLGSGRGSLGSNECDADGMIYREVALIPFLMAAGLFPSRPVSYVEESITITNKRSLRITTPAGEASNTCVYVSLGKKGLLIEGGASLVEKIRGQGLKKLVEE